MCIPRGCVSKSSEFRPPPEPFKNWSLDKALRGIHKIHGCNEKLMYTQSILLIDQIINGMREGRIGMLNAISEVTGTITELRRYLDASGSDATNICDNMLIKIA